MIKIILPNSDQYFCKYESTLSIKEVLNDFYKKKTISPGTYEAYNPVNSTLIDYNQNLNEYGRISIYLRQVNPQNVKKISYGRMSNLDSCDSVWNFEKIRTFSESFNDSDLCTQNNSKKSMMSKLKQRFSSKKYYISQPNQKNFESKVENKLSIQSNIEISNESSYKNPSIQNDSKIKKMKKKEKSIINKETLNLSFDENVNSKLKFIDLEIPLPPPYSQEYLNEIQYYPWQSNVECGLNCDIEEDIYSENYPIYSKSFDILPNSDVSDTDRNSPEHFYSQIMKNHISLKSGNHTHCEHSKHVDASLLNARSNQSSISSVDSNEIFLHYSKYDSHKKSISETSKEDSEISDSVFLNNSSVNQQNI